MMHQKGLVLAIATLCCHTSSVASALVKDAAPQVQYPGDLGTQLNAVAKLHDLATISVTSAVGIPFHCSRKTVNVSSRSTNLTFPPDLFIYNGPLGVYRFSSYSGIHPFFLRVGRDVLLYMLRRPFQHSFNSKPQRFRSVP